MIQRWERGTDDLFWSLGDPLQVFFSPLRCSWRTSPHISFCGALVEVGEEFLCPVFLRDCRKKVECMWMYVCLHLFHLLSINRRTGIGCILFMFPEVNDKLLCLAGIEEQVIVLTPGCEGLDLLSVGHLIVIGYHPHHGYVVSKLVCEIFVINRSVEMCGNWIRVDWEHSPGECQCWGWCWMRWGLQVSCAVVCWRGSFKSNYEAGASDSSLLTRLPEVNNQHSHIGLRVFRVSCLRCHPQSICWFYKQTDASPGQRGWRLNRCHHQSLKAFHDYQC